MSAKFRLLLLACSVVPVFGVFIVDAVFNYFFAIRQMIFILPPLTVLAVDGLVTLMGSALRKVVIGAGLLTIVFVFADISWMRRPRENWGLAAGAVQQLRSEYSACVVYIPLDSLTYYAFFEPTLQTSTCPSNSVTNGTTVVAIAPYASEEDRTAAQEVLKRKQPIATRTLGMSTIYVLR